jgi:CBS domain-containing protein
MQAKDVMSTAVASVAPEATVREAAQAMLARGVSALPVLDQNGTLVGIVSEGDLVRRTELGTEPAGSWWLLALAEGAARDYRKSHARVVRDVMTRPVIWVRPSEELAQIARLLHERRIKRVPVLDEGRLVGIVSRADLLRQLARS